MKFQNPGPWSFGVFAAAAAVVIAMFAFKVPDAGRAAIALVSLVGVWFSKSALASKDGDS
jgi:hypothetical protein